MGWINVTITLTDEQHDWLKQAGDLTGHSVTEFVTRLAVDVAKNVAKDLG